MSKESAKLKEEMKAELQKFKDEVNQTLKIFKETVERDLRGEIRELRQEQQALKESIEYAHAEIDDLKKQLETEQSITKQRTQEKGKLQAQCEGLEKKAFDLERRLTQSEQYSRCTNLEIQGVPKSENESVFDVVFKIGEAISENITASDVEVCHRVPTRDPLKTNIIVQFKSRTKRDTVLKKAKKTRLNHKDIGLDTAAPVYVNEHLCPALKRLLGMAVKRKHECLWKSVWSYNGKIFAKKTENSDPVHISDERDLAKMTPNAPTTTPVEANAISE